MKGDQRNYLYVQYAKYLERYQPKLFVFENVLGLLSAGNDVYLDNMKKLFKAKGYDIKISGVEANNWGVLQNRKRIIIVGWKEGKEYLIPNLDTIRVPAIHKVNSLLSDLPKIQAGKITGRCLKYRTTLDHTISFLKWKFKRSDSLPARRNKLIPIK